MTRIAGTIFALLFLVWGGLTIVGGLIEGRADWTLLGGVLAAFGLVFLPAVRSLWADDRA